jgi:hypothetical protein
MDDKKQTYKFVEYDNFFSVDINGMKYNVSQEAALIARAILALADTIEKIGSEK